MDDLYRPQAYQITVRGLLPQNWADCFNSATICVEATDDGTFTTVMTQFVADQAALQGILNRLCDLNLTLISCTRIAQPGSGDPGAHSEKESGQAGVV